MMSVMGEISMSSRRLREFVRRASHLLQGFMALLECVGSQTSPKRPFVNEQPALPADAAAVSGKTPISADDSMARNHNGNRVCRIGQANRARTDFGRPNCRASAP